MNELERNNEDLKAEIKDLRKDLASEKLAAEKVGLFIKLVNLSLRIPPMPEKLTVKKII